MKIYTVSLVLTPRKVKNPWNESRAAISSTSRLQLDTLLRDPYFGLDWTRNLAMAIEQSRIGHPLTPHQTEKINTGPLNGIDYIPDLGYKIEDLEFVLYNLAARSPEIYILLPSAHITALKMKPCSSISTGMFLYSLHGLTTLHPVRDSYVQPFLIPVKHPGAYSGSRPEHRNPLYSLSETKSCPIRSTAIRSPSNHGSSCSCFPSRQVNNLSPPQTLILSRNLLIFGVDL